ncbi:MAG: 1-acyl-sn-glycerol-3-phosphate acyltransferase [Acidobacteria bacterium]|nr:1-acyl-sn-glycerol-3-phosphate acyltransferase [Acidobacteriota bacterium]
MAGTSRLRAYGRVATFAVGSWLVVGGAWRAVFSRFPARWARSCAPVSGWSRLGARCLGIYPRVVGELPPPGSLVVANHQGYADIVTVGGLFPSIFAARHDMRTWPMFGALARNGATIFINRDNKRAGYRGIGQVTAALVAGATVIAFPEGTSTDGRGLLPFRTGVFQSAVDAGVPVVPAAVRYLELDGEPVTDANRDVVGWFRGEPFVGHILRLASHRRALAEVAFGEPIRPPHADRRTLAAEAEARVRALLAVGPDQVPSSAGKVLGGVRGGE